MPSASGYIAQGSLVHRVLVSNRMQRYAKGQRTDREMVHQTWKVFLVLGGARSGKSALAEQLAAATGLARHYVATCAPWPGDSDMAARIALHRQRRGSDWRVTEAPMDLLSILRDASTTEVVLIDCASLWLTNHLLGESDLAAETDALCAALAECRARVIIVSNETGLGIIPENALARRFRDAQGLLNQRLATHADGVAMVVAGIPMVLKGSLPENLSAP